MLHAQAIPPSPSHFLNPRACGSGHCGRQLRQHSRGLGLPWFKRRILWCRLIIPHQDSRELDPPIARWPYADLISNDEKFEMVCCLKLYGLEELPQFTRYFSPTMGHWSHTLAFPALILRLPPRIPQPIRGVSRHLNAHYGLPRKPLDCQYLTINFGGGRHCPWSGYQVASDPIPRIVFPTATTRPILRRCASSRSVGSTK